MRLVYNETETQIQESCTPFFAEQMPVSHFRKLRDQSDDLGYDRALWKQIAELGWTGILVPESLGGFDMGVSAAGLIAEQAGHHLSPSPYLSSGVYAASLLSQGKNEALLAGILSGEQVFGIALEESHHFQNKAPTTQLIEGKVSGEKKFALDAYQSDYVLVNASDAKGGIVLLAFPSETKGLTITARHMVDYRNYADVKLDQVDLNDGVLVLENAAEAIANATTIARAVLASEMLGSANAAFQMTLAYVKEREQFKQKVGSFQAIQHRCAEMFMELETARSAVIAALTSLTDQEGDVDRLALLAKAEVGKALQLISKEAIQMHGGMGVTDEFDVGFYLKRARVQEQQLGSRNYCLDALATSFNF